MADKIVRFDDGAAYERMMGIWSRHIGEDFLDWLNLRDTLTAQTLIGGKRGPHSCAIRAREDRRERHSVFYGLVGALPEMRKHWMRGVPQKRQPTTRPGRERLAIVQSPSKCHLHLLQKRLDARVPTGKFAAKHIGISG